MRVLLVICRPRAGDDVPFRSIASRIVKTLSDEAREFVQLDVLRPPTFEQLSKVLHQAKARGQPYHIVHFDGHGVYEEVSRLADWLKRLSPLILGAGGKHGFLVFENPLNKDNVQYVDGATLGKVLTDNDTPVLILNACRSAFADPPQQPLDASQVGDVGEQVRAFGSLAQAVANAGVAGIVAMRYTLYVETAKEFIANLYAALAQGQSLGEAVTFGRKQLALNPLREIAFKPIALQDWCVPIVYETTAIKLFPDVGATHTSPLLNTALEFYLQALALLPPNAVMIWRWCTTNLATSTAMQATLTARCNTTARQFATMKWKDICIRQGNIVSTSRSRSRGQDGWRTRWSTRARRCGILNRSVTARRK